MAETKKGTDETLPSAQSAWPEWCTVPDGLVFPKGRAIIPVRFRADWTDKSSAGDRQAILWSLSDLDEKTVISRAMGDTARLVSEYSKIMVRAFDGKAHLQDGTTDGEFAMWWGEIGQKCRDMIWKLYLQLHRLNDKERADFFDNCIAHVVIG
jgi:hypothetical protein